MCGSNVSEMCACGECDVQPYICIVNMRINACVCTSTCEM